jgi:hypothetical protein
MISIAYFRVSEIRPVPEMIADSNHRRTHNEATRLKAQNISAVLFHTHYAFQLKILQSLHYFKDKEKEAQRK